MTSKSAERGVSVSASPTQQQQDGKSDEASLGTPMNSDLVGP